MKEELKEIFKNSLEEALEFVNAQITEARSKDYWWYVKRYEKYPTISTLDSGLPTFHLSNNERIDYAEILMREETGHNLNSWTEYRKFVMANSYIQKFFELGEFLKDYNKDDSEVWIKIRTSYPFAAFVDRYIHLNSEKFNFNQTLFDRQFNLWYNSIFEERLAIEVYIPILMLKFDFDEYTLDERTSIRKMQESFQLSRHDKLSYTDSSTANVAGAATHALVINNWTVENKTFDSRERILNEFGSYSAVLEIVSSFFSALRVSTGNYSGFCQLVAKPLFWEDRVKGKLDQAYTVSNRNYPDYFDDYGWLNSPPIISEIEATDIGKLYKSILLNSSNQISLALSRLNTAYLRSREEDTILDITIALETVLTHDSRNEITYRLASRMAMLCKILPFKEYDEFDVFKFCKKIYSYRSAIVHGSDNKKIEKTRLIKHKEGKELPTISLSIELLRHVLYVLINNPEYIDLEKIDKLKFTSPTSNL